MKPHHVIAVAASLLALCICGITGFVTTGSILVALPAALLARYVWADFEGTFTAACVCLAGAVLLAMAQHGAGAAVAAAAGGFLAAEVAIVGARMHRRTTGTGAATAAMEMVRNLGLGLAAMLAAGVVALFHPPAWVAGSALALSALGALAGAALFQLRSARR